MGEEVVYSKKQKLRSGLFGWCPTQMNIGFQPHLALEFELPFFFFQDTWGEEKRRGRERERWRRRPHSRSTTPKTKARVREMWDFLLSKSGGGRIEFPIWRRRKKPSQHSIVVTALSSQVNPIHIHGWEENCIEEEEDKDILYAHTHTHTNWI